MDRRDFLQQSMLLGAGLFAGSGLLYGPDGEVLAATSKPAKRVVAPKKAPPKAPHEKQSLVSPLQHLQKVDAKKVRFRIALVTDPHLGIKDKSMDFKVLRYSPFLVSQHFLQLRNFEHLTGRKVDLLLMPGDLTRDSEPWNHVAMRKYLRTLSVPSLVIPGNHDVFKKWMTPKHWGIDQFVAGYQGRYGGYQGKQAYYAHEVTPGLVIIGLNSSDTPDGSLRSTWNGRIDNKQLKWFGATLAKYAGKKKIIVMVHHNIVAHHAADKESSKSNWKNFHTDNGDAVLKLMTKYGCHLVVTGHHHANRITRHPKFPVTEIVTSGACSYPASFRILDWSVDGKSVSVHTVSPPWKFMLDKIAAAARKDKFWKLPDKPKDAEAMLAFLWGRSQDREATISLVK